MEQVNSLCLALSLVKKGKKDDLQGVEVLSFHFTLYTFLKIRGHPLPSPRPWVGPSSNLSHSSEGPD